DRIRHALRGEVREAAEDEGEDDHRQEWLEDRSRYADRRLLVADCDIPPDERPEKLAEVPQLAHVQMRPPRSRANRGHPIDALWRLGRLGGRPRAFPPLPPRVPQWRRRVAGR